MALDRLCPRRPATGRSCSRTLCAELTYGSPLERRQALADEAIAIARSSGDDATIVRVLTHRLEPARRSGTAPAVVDWTTEALVRAERLGDPVLLFWAAWSRAGTAARALDIDEMDRCLEIMGSRAAQLDQPMLNWVHSYARAVRAQIAGDTDQAEQWATEGTPDRHRQRPTRRHPLLRPPARGREPPTRNVWRAGPTPRADGRRRSRPRRSVRRGACAGPCRSRPDRRRSSPAGAGRCRRLRCSARRDWLSTLAYVRRGRHRVPRPEVFPDAVRPPRALGRSGAVSGPNN